MIPSLRCLMMYSAARMDSAMMVSVGFFSLDVVKQLPSVTKRFFTSCDWQKLFKAEVLGSFPMRMVPTSWLANPAGAVLSSRNTSAGEFGSNLLKAFSHPLPEQRVVLHELEVDHRNRNAMRIHLVLVDGNVILLARPSICQNPPGKDIPVAWSAPGV